MRNIITFTVYGRYALFTDPISRIGGEKTTYHIPTYEALKGICKSIYWKPTLIWHVDKVRVMNTIRTQTKGTKPLKWAGSGNDLAYYTFLHDVAYQVEAHFTWNLHRPELAVDRIDGKHYSIAQRMLSKGGSRDIFLGTRDCQGYVESCTFGQGVGAYDDVDELAYGTMFHSFGYPDETGRNELRARLWQPTMKHGIITFPELSDNEAQNAQQGLVSRVVRPMTAKRFAVNDNMQSVDVLSQQMDEEA